jgi:hypothetical protein
MRIGVWNIDHAQIGSPSEVEEKRFQGVVRYLEQTGRDLLITTEGNAAIQIPGYRAEFSDPSPFRSTRRYYGEPNLYHQVGIYSRLPMRRLNVDEPINGLLCEVSWEGESLLVYGNVITIKDQWKKDSGKTHKDRLREQLAAIESLASSRFIAAGDFNLSLGWTRMLPAHRELNNLVQRLGLVWPTEKHDDTVQHVLHSPDFKVEVEIDFSVRHVNGGEQRLSDHPFLSVTLRS